jgi:hypothetical protein
VSVRILSALWAACVFITAAAFAAPAKNSAFGVYEGYAEPAFPDQIESSFYLPMRDGAPASTARPPKGASPWYGTTASTGGPCLRRR